MRTWTFEPERYPRLGPAWRAAEDVLSDGRWHAQTDVLAAIEATAVAPKTARNLIRDARKAGRIEARGQWTGTQGAGGRWQRAADTREVRLAP